MTGPNGGKNNNGSMRPNGNEGPNIRNNGSRRPIKPEIKNQYLEYLHIHQLSKSNLETLRNSLDELDRNDEMRKQWNKLDQKNRREPRPPPNAQLPNKDSRAMMLFSYFMRKKPSNFIFDKDDLNNLIKRLEQFSNTKKLQNIARIEYNMYNGKKGKNGETKIKYEDQKLYKNFMKNIQKNAFREKKDLLPKDIETSKNRYLNWMNSKLIKLGINQEQKIFEQIWTGEKLINRSMFENLSKKFPNNTNKPLKQFVTFLRTKKNQFEFKPKDLINIRKIFGKMDIPPEQKNLMKSVVETEYFLYSLPESVTKNMMEKYKKFIIKMIHRQDYKYPLLINGQNKQGRNYTFNEEKKQHNWFKSKLNRVKHLPPNVLNSLKGPGR